MFGNHRLVEVVCPHCGSSQMEPRGVLSTYCRSCSQHFSTTATRTGDQRTSKPTRVVWDSSEERSEARIACHSCGHVQRPHYGVPEAPCRNCGTLMSYRDIEISNHSTREICTHGKVLVTRRGFLNSTRVRCASAHVEGRIAGRIDCSGELRLSGKDMCKAQIHVGALHVERNAEITLIYSAVIGSGVIAGHLSGDVICSGSLRVTRHGKLLGDVESRSLSVDRGGVYSGDVFVGHERQKAAPTRSEHARESVDGIWLPGFGLGAA